MAKNFNSSALPEHCYAVLPGSGQLIEVRRGERATIPVPTPPATVSITRFWQITSMPMRAFQRHRRQLCWPVPCLAGMFLLPILPVTMQRASRSNREKRKRPPDRRNISTSRQSSSGRTTSPEPRLCWMKRWKIPTVKCLRD